MKQPVAWSIWILLTATAGGLVAHTMVKSDDKSLFVIGPASHGHYQIEMACTTCHREPFGGDAILQEACTQCHREELREAHDSHPKSKFTDPRNADRLSVIDARLCISCHTEHQLEYTQSMGVTLPNDFCFHCHVELGEERASHKDLNFDTCASAGCHNYHDNRALYEDFLLANAHQNWLLENPPAEKSPRLSSTLKKTASITAENSQSPEKIALYPAETDEWQHSSHARAGVDCKDCHTDKKVAGNAWIDKPDHQQCRYCHEHEAGGFTQGKHGMRLSAQLSQTLSPMTPGQARLPFHAEARSVELTCNTCHAAHTFSPEHAAVHACLNCHNDEHSQHYLTSPHANLESALTCAGCHMPLVPASGTDGAWVVQHNQNWNLRPNEKMIRSVCLDCHGLQFTLDALADRDLIRRNFSGRPEIAIPSIDWALKRQMETATPKPPEPSL
jgi:hypothetical protein